MIRRRRFSRLFPIILWVLDRVPLVTRGDTLTAFNNSFHAAELYSEVRNDERPPYVSEPHTDSDARMRLCSELMDSDYFAELGITPVDMSRPPVLRELLRRQNFWIFDLIYEGSGEESEREYSNRYHLRDFRVEDGLGKRTLRSFIFTTEWVFVCLVRKHSYTSTIVPYFVSREFDTGIVLENGPDVEIATRFIFESTDKVQRVVMAEEPAVGYVNMDYNIEHHYIELKQDHPTANRSDKDPLCQIVPKGHPHNRHDRLCASVLGSSYFSSTEIKKPQVKKNRDHCFRHPVSFQTDLGKLTTTRSRIMPVYYEWMIECKAVVARGFGRQTWINFYVSRAYNSTQLFVYRVRLVNGDPRAYLENLSTRISFFDNGSYSK